MLIECKLKREGGSKIDLGKNLYHFQPLADGAHVAQVDDEADQDRLLGITEGYRLYRGELEPTGPSVIGTGKPPAVVAPVGTEPVMASLPVTFTVHGRDYTKQEIAAMAVDAGDITMHDWNEMDEDSRENLMIEQLDKLQKSSPLVEAPSASVTSDADLRADAVTRYQAVFNGSKPHHNRSIDWINEAIAKGPQ